MWELDHKEGWAPKNWCFRIVVLLCCRRLLRVPWTARSSIQSILRKSTLNTHWKDWSWSWSSNTLTTWCEELIIGKDSAAGKDWGQKEEGASEDEMVRLHHRLNRHAFELTLRQSLTEDPGTLQLMGSQSVGHSLVTEQEQQWLLRYFLTTLYEWNETL